MLIKNLEQGQLVNGSTGQVRSFMKPRDAVLANTRVCFADDILSAGSKSRLKVEQIIEKLGEEKVWPLVKFENGREVKQYLGTK